jgi:tetratricopeptide (TPR) repeat protein
MGCTYYDDEDLSEAIRYFEKTQSLDPDHKYSLLALIQSFSRIGEIEKAEALAEDRIRRFAGREDAFVVKINEEMLDLYFANGLYEKALALKDLVLDENGETEKGVVYMDIANCEYEAGNDDVAASLYEKALERSPDNDVILEDYAHFLRFARKDYEKAITLLEKAVELNDVPHNRIRLAKAYQLAGNKSAAKLNFERTANRLKKILKTAKTACFCNQLGECYYHLGKIKKAEKYLLEAMKQSGDTLDCNKHCCYEAAFILALINRERGDLTKAKEYFDIVMKTKPDREYREAADMIAE